MIQLVDEKISQEERADRMASLLVMLQTARVRMKPVGLFNGDTDENVSSRVPSLIESCLVHIILAPESRVFSDCWVAAGKLIDPELTDFDDLNKLLPTEQDIEEELQSEAPLTPCAGWFLQRLLEIACFIPNMSVENTQLINFDKRRFVYNCISNIVTMVPSSHGKDVSETGFAFLLGFRTQQLDLKSIFKMAREHNEGIRIFKSHIADQLKLLRLEHAKRSLLLKQEAERLKSSRTTLNNFDMISLNTVTNSNQSIKRMPDFIRTGGKPQSAPSQSTHNSMMAQQHYASSSRASVASSSSGGSSSRFKLPGFFKSSNKFSFNHQHQSQQQPQEIVRVRKANELPSGESYVTTKNNKPVLAVNLKNYRRLDL
ncbi:unnamed protein product [Ambrosiozyma monospora]|uniref:Unnamed protein product n=1 Tax=Ambrosiozyma monospora TaxID=43982 RepID=A0ACB5TT58_AMBMO|nr:unnamed protein product [Ambrosiozyma monospora]